MSLFSCYRVRNRTFNMLGYYTMYQKPLANKTIRLSSYNDRMLHWNEEPWLHTILYGSIDLILLNKLHGTMHCKIGVTCVYNGHMFYTLL